MSKAVFICSRAGAPVPFRSRDIETLFARLAPDNITPRPPRILEGDGILIGIFNPTASIVTEQLSVCLGAVFGHEDDWWRPGATIPDGNYVLFRADEATVEILTDVVGSRTVWYAMTDDYFIASTSQRAIIYFLQSYEPNERAYPWMLSSGTLGPGYSWDRRIQCLPGDGRLVLDRVTWTPRLSAAPVVYSAEPRPADEHESLLQEAIRDTCAQLRLDWARWMLPLSGGYDSRALLQTLYDRPGLKSITWGTKSALDDIDSDACVASELARHYRVPHRYHVTDSPDEPVEKLLARFLIAGEGRIDHVSGYMDGFAIWKHLHESGCDGIIRGDEAFGCRAVRSDREVYRNMSMQRLSDFSNLARVGRVPGLAPQSRPAALEQQSHETREMWRDRVNIQFEFPFVFAPLSDLKLSYVEIVNPLVSRRVVQRVRAMPDALRTGKSAFKNVVNQRGDGVRYAKRAAIRARDNILRESPVADTLLASLRARSGESDAIGSLSRCAVELIREGAGSSRRLSAFGESRLVRKLKSLFGLGSGDERLDPFCFAFRVYVIASMRDILAQDARALGEAT